MGTRKAEPRYELYYWPGIPGRGEFVRLVFEDAGVPYLDMARLPEEEGGGVAALERFLRVPRGGRVEGALPFAPPFLKIGDRVLAQTPLISHFLAQRFGLVPEDEALALEALQHALTLADLVVEAHDTHHPVAVDLRYEAQKPESARRAEAFREARMPKFLHYFEEVLRQNRASGGRALVGPDHSYVDLSLFQVLLGLEHAFPNAFARVMQRKPHLRALRERVAERPRIAAYLASDRRLPFASGIFRRYPELDPP